jgi:hypothetical protein
MVGVDEALDSDGYQIGLPFNLMAAQPKGIALYET